jgi:hypothetical protein
MGLILLGEEEKWCRGDPSSSSSRDDEEGRRTRRKMRNLLKKMMRMFQAVELVLQLEVPLQALELGAQLLLLLLVVVLLLMVHHLVE